MRPRSLLALLATLLAAAPAPAQAVDRSRVVAYDGTAVDGQVLIPRFDPRLGQLERVHLTVQLETRGGFGFENTGAGPNLVSAGFGAYARVLAPGGAQLAEAVTPPLECDHVLPPFDGKVDLAGTSGATFRGLSSADLAQRTWHADPVWIAGIVAAEGPVALALEVTDTTSIRGSGPLVVRRAQTTSAVLVVEYEYTPNED